MNLKPLSFLAVIIPVLFYSCIPDQETLTDNHFIVGEGNRPMVIAHGGAKLLYPENTMLAFDSVVAMGVDVLEMDVCITKDGVLVTHHDETIDRTSDGSGKVSDYDYSELLDFNFGYDFESLDGTFPYRDKDVDIAKLEDVISRHGHMYMIIEIKDDGELGEKAADKMKELIENQNMQSKVIVASFHHEVLDYFLDISDGSIPISTSKKEATKFVVTAKTYSGWIYHPEAVALQLPMEELGLKLGKKHIIKSAHRHNMAIHYWTINDRDDMEDLIEKGADGIITDRPDIMFELLEDMGY